MDNSNATARLIRSVLARIGEVVLMVGFQAIGLVAALPDLSRKSIITSTVFLLCGFALFLSIYIYNTWGGMIREAAAGVASYDRKLLNFLNMVSFLLLLASIAGFALVFETWTLIFAVAIYFLWLLYSHPLIHLKAVAGAGTGIHIVAGTLHYILGYSAFKTPGPEAILGGLFFALLFAGGHAVHELKDMERDKKTGFRTGAIVLGAKKIHTLGFLFFSLATGLLVISLQLNLLPEKLYAPFLLPYPAAAVAFAITIRHELNEKTARRYRLVYRIAYFLAGVAFIIIRINEILKIG
ncbi:MAG: UbiA family prenyltransferase [Planctomycetota bacterium]